MRFLLSFLFALRLSAADSLTPGEVTTPFPTINHLAIEWQIEGDDDLDATCEVKVRKEGETAWRDAEALRRVPAGKSQKTSPIFARPLTRGRSDGARGDIFLGDHHDFFRHFPFR